MEHQDFSKSILFWICFFLLVIIKYCYFGFEYFPILDDWIQYGVYYLKKISFIELAELTNIYANRPLAGVFDYYIWSPFWHNMGFVFIIMTLLHFLSGYFLFMVFKFNNLKVGNVFLVAYYLFPLGSEATYWISNSTRNVVGMFVMSLSLFFASHYISYQHDISKGDEFDNIGDFVTIDTNWRKIWKYRKILLAVIFYILNLISFGFYEPVILLSVSCSIILLLYNYKYLKNKYIILLPLIDFVFIGSYYLIFKDKISRFKFISNNIFEHAITISIQISTVWIDAANAILYKGAYRGLLQIISENNTFLLIVLSGIVYIISGYIVTVNFEKSFKESFIKVLVGILLFIVPYIGYFFIEESGINFRNAFTSFVGFALILDGTIGYILYLFEYSKSKVFIVFIIVMGFILANISELTDYKNISKIDNKLTKNIIRVANDRDFLNGRKRAYLLNVKMKSVQTNYLFGDHIKSIMEIDWALTGALRAQAKTDKVSVTIPLPDKAKYYIPYEDFFGKKIFFGIGKGLIVYKLIVSVESAHTIKFFSQEAVKFAEMNLDDKGYYHLEVWDKFKYDLKELSDEQ